MGYRSGRWQRNMVNSTSYSGDYIPVRGDVVEINLDPQKGSEIRKRRPAVVVSSWNFNLRQNIAVVCPITRTVRGIGFEVPIPDGLPVNGVIRVDQVKSLDWHAREAKYLCYLPDEIIDAVSDKIEAIIWGE